MASTVGVRLKKDWFGPGGVLYEMEDNPHEFPADWAAKPKQAKDETDEDWKLREKRQPFAVLPSSAVLVDGGGKTVVVLQNTANGEQLVVPTLVDDDVESVGGALDEKGFEKSDQSVASAEKGADAYEAEVGGVPRKSGPLPAAASDKKK